MLQGSKKFWPAGAVFLLLLALASFCLPGEKAKQTINIGVADDSSRYLFEYLITDQKFNAKLHTMLGVYPFKDCCSSSAAWALSTNDLDMAVICPDAAQRLIKKDARYMIVGPCRVNSDVLLLHTAKTPQSLGITQNREYQKDLAQARFGPDIKIYPMLGNALPYAYREKRIDGAVLDIAGAQRLSGRRESLRRDKDIVTYVLVVRKTFLQEPVIRQFVQCYNQAVTDLEDVQLLQETIEKYAGYACNGKEASEWKKMNVRNLPLTIAATK